MVCLCLCTSDLTSMSLSFFIYKSITLINVHFISLQVFYVSNNIARNINVYIFLCICPCILFFYIFNIFKRFYLLLERGEGREKERDRNIDVLDIHQLVASCTPPIGELACNPGVCPNWELNGKLFSLLASTQSTEPHQPRLNVF